MLQLLQILRAKKKGSTQLIEKLKTFAEKLLRAGSEHKYLAQSPSKPSTLGTWSLNLKKARLPNTSAFPRS